MRTDLVAGLALALISSELGAESTAAPPPLAVSVTAATPCPRLKPADYADRERKAPLAIPAAYVAIASATLNHIAVTTLAGTRLCVNTTGVESADGYRLTRDNRFFHYQWYGNEAGGYIIVDRTGRGGALDVGAIPTFSPSRARFASIEISESGFGSLNGFLVVAVEPTGMRQIAKLENIPMLADWRIHGWQGEGCINLSGVRQQDIPENWSDLPKARRTRYMARASAAGWTLTRSATACPAA
jgi:hypothetical protein